jgi:hypothetical protein
VHDAVEAELAEVPAVAICTAQFRQGAEAVARMRGLPEYRFAVVDHPLGVLDGEELRERAEQALPQVVAVATGSD